MSHQSIYNALVKAGMTREGACALMGNMQAESRIKSTIVQIGATKLSDSQYTSAADNGLIDFVRDEVGYGLCQWTHPDRKGACWTTLKTAEYLLVTRQCRSTSLSMSY